MADLRSSRRLYFGQIQAVLLSEHLARTGGTAAVVDYFLRSPKTRSIAFMYVVPDDAVQAVAGVMPSNAAYPAQAVAYMSLVQRENGDVPPLRLFELANHLASHGESAALPVLTTVKGGFMQSGIALFRRLDMVARLGVDEARTLGLLTPRTRMSMLTIPCNGAGTATAELRQIRTALGTIIRQGRVAGFTLRLTGSLHIDHLDHCPTTLQPPAETALRSAAASILVGRISSLHRALADVKSDPLGFGDVLRATSPAAWSHVASTWPAPLASLPLQIQVRLSPDDSGLLHGTLDEGGQA